MKLINTTNSHAVLIQSQLESTDATLLRLTQLAIPMLSLPKHPSIMKY